MHTFMQEMDRVKAQQEASTSIAPGWVEPKMLYCTWGHVKCVLMYVLQRKSAKSNEIENVINGIF